jgi:ferredoxin
VPKLPVAEEGKKGGTSITAIPKPHNLSRSLCSYSPRRNRTRLNRNRTPLKDGQAFARGHAMKTVYACTHVEKCAEKDSFDQGCDPDSRVCLMHERCNFQADSLPGLLQALGKHLCLDIDDVFVPDDDGEVTCVGYNRLEDEDGEEPSDDQKRRWKAGEEKLYLADYRFLIERRTVEPIRLEEFAGNSIKFHG